MFIERTKVSFYHYLKKIAAIFTSVLTIFNENYM